MADALFQPDADGLRRAVERLIAARSAAGEPMPSSAGSLLPTTLPAVGLGAEHALNWAIDVGIAQAARLDHPGYLAHMDPPTPWPTWVTATIAASTNQNLLHPDAAPLARDLEARVIDWLAPSFGMGGGHLVPGSTLANLTALWAARELVGIRHVVASSAAHLSVPKAAHILGLTFREIPVDDRQRIQVDQLFDLDDTAVVLTAGTVAAGAIDPLDAAPDAAWRHVDAAWAGPLRFTRRHRHLLDGIERADSVSMSAHKWLYQPKEAAMVLFADTNAAHDAISFGGSYLAAPNVGLLGSHGAAPALNLAVTLLTLGTDGLATRIDADMANADRLCDLIDTNDSLELRAPHTTGVVNWRVPGSDLITIQRNLTNAWISTATIAGEPWLRSVTVNPNADPDHVVNAVLAAAQ